MAPRADDIRQGYVSDLLRLLEPRPGRFEFALRLALICALTLLVTEIYQTPEPALTVYIAFFLNREDRATSLVMNIVFLALISVIVGLTVLLAMAVIDNALWRVITIVVFSFCFLFLTSASKLRPVGSTVALIVAYALDLLGSVPLSEAATRGILYAWLFVGIPAGVSILVNLLLAPSPRRLAEQAIARRLEVARDMLRMPNERVRRHFRECLREGTGEIQTWLRLASVEKTSRPEDLTALHHAANSTVSLLSAVELIDRDPEAELPVVVDERLAQTLEEMAAILRTGGYPIAIEWDATLDGASVPPLTARILAYVGDTLRHFTAARSGDVPAAEARNEEGGFFAKDAFSNPDHVHYALKTTGAAIFCYLLYSLLDWPSIHTCFITCYIVSLGTAAETVEKLTLRIAGCLLGAAAGVAAIVFLVPSITSIGALMVVVFLGALASAYVAGGSPRIAYAGFQIAFAFFLCVVQGAAPSFDMTIVRDRVIGILLGNLVTYLVFTNFWPVSVTGRIDPAFATLLRRLSAMLSAADAATRRALASDAWKALAAIETDLALARYEPGSVRPSDSWVSARQDAAREIGALQSPLLLTADQGPASAAPFAGRLEALAMRLETPALVPSAEGQSRGEVHAPGRLHAIIDRHMQNLERSFT